MKIKKSKGAFDMLKKNNKYSGFTIIEVMIVLAIAGLILLIVFLAIPALQRNSRNTQRKDDAAKYAAAYSEDANNNNGAAPTGTTPGAAVKAASASQLTTVDYNVVTTSPMAAIASPMVDGTAYIRNGSTCASGSGGQIGTAGGSLRAATVSYIVESPGATATGNAPAGYISQCVAAG